ncbi:hypothetical protein ACJQWK_11177 [Exserohilum turcicum]
MSRKHGHQRPFQCAICEDAFSTKAELSRHTESHIHNPVATSLVCDVCKWDFDDSHALELHRFQAGHGTLNFSCENCDEHFVSQKGLDEHNRPPFGCTRALTEKKDTAVVCDRCKKSFSTRKRYNDHRSDLASECADWRNKTPKKQAQTAPQGYVDLGKPKNGQAIRSYEDPAQESDASTNTSNGGLQCKDCKKKFVSQSHYNNHFLGCEPIVPRSQLGAIQNNSRNGHQATAPAQELHFASNTSYAKSGSKTKADTTKAMPTQKKPVRSQQQKPSPASVTRVYTCDSCCARSFGSATSLAQHKATSKKKKPVQSQQQQTPPASSAPARDTGIYTCSSSCGKSFGSAASLAQHRASVHGTDGRRLNTNGRGPDRGGKSNNTSTQPPPPQHIASRPPSVPVGPPRTIAPRHVPPSQPSVTPTSTNIGSATDIEQAKQIQARALRLLIQSDIFIHYDGKISIGGLDWTRIGVEKHAEVVDKLDKMCHLPRVLQSEYLPAPKAFADEYNAYYDLADFKPSPARDAEKPGLSVVVLACSKVGLANDRHEVVKLAAIDLTTSAILMNHFVCTDPHAQVSAWNSAATGLSSWRDMEAARQAGYKIFKGWSAARAALHKYIDTETILVGHNLRSDLDALRMVHGRAVDIAKVVEKAANGPLSKPQLSLDSLCCDYTDKKLSRDPKYGRDCLVDAFAIRQFVLYAIKNKEMLEREARLKSVDYQRVRPCASTATGV